LLVFSFLCSFSPKVDGVFLLFALFIVSNNCWCPSFLSFVHSHLQLLVLFFLNKKFFFSIFCSFVATINTHLLCSLFILTNNYWCSSSLNK
jgi:hypothetical protein